MEMNHIENLINEWKDAVDKVISFEEIGTAKLKLLFAQTFEVLSEYKDDALIPKQIGELIFEMNDFSWWVSGLNETPLNEYSSYVVTIVLGYKRYFFVGDYDKEEVEEALEIIRG